MEKWRPAAWKKKTNRMTCAPFEESDRPGQPTCLIRVFAVRSIGSYGLKVPSCGQRRLWSDWADAQADLRLCRAHIWFCLFCRAPTQMTSSLQKQMSSQGIKKILPEGSLKWRRLGWYSIQNRHIEVRRQRTIPYNNLSHSQGTKISNKRINNLSSD